jgi:hypothetical protein
MEKMAGAGDFAGSSDEGYFQNLAFGYRIALKQYRDTLLILRHHGGLPASPASLVQKVGESIFVFAGMPRQLHHDSLVFFHEALEIKGSVHLLC